MEYQYNDGGRKAAGFKGTAGDCGARAMTIALGLDYKAVYKELAQANSDNGRAKSARNGINKDTYTEVLKRHGWEWVTAPRFTGRRARCSDMPKGMVIARQAHHFVAVLSFRRPKRSATHAPNKKPAKLPAITKARYPVEPMTVNLRSDFK